jgi:hypothetical protein
MCVPPELAPACLLTQERRLDPMRTKRERLVIIPVLAALVGAVALAAADDGPKNGSPLTDRPVVADPVEEASPELERLAIPQPTGQADTPLVAPVPASPSR